MSGVNKAIIVGHLGGAPDIRSLQSGGKVASFSVATGESWRDKTTGERKERTDWHRVVVFTEGLVKVCEQYLHKGSKVYIEGKMQTRKWTDQGGQERTVTEVILNSFGHAIQMLDRREGVPANDGAEESRSPAGASRTSPDDAPANRALPARGSNSISSGRHDLDDEIPF